MAENVQPIPDPYDAGRERTPADLTSGELLVREVRWWRRYADAVLDCQYGGVCKDEFDNPANWCPGCAIEVVRAAIALGIDPEDP